MGLWHEDIDSTAELPGGIQLCGINDLQEHLLQSYGDRVASLYTTHSPRVICFANCCNPFNRNMLLMIDEYRIDPSMTARHTSLRDTVRRLCSPDTSFLGTVAG